MGYKIIKYKLINPPRWSFFTILTAIVLALFIINKNAFGFDWQVQGQGHSLSLIPAMAMQTIKWSRANAAGNLSSQIAVSLKVQYRIRNQNLETNFFELQYNKFTWDELPHPAFVSSRSGYTIGAFAGQKSSSRNRFLIGYSLGVTQEYFIASASQQQARLEKSWVYHGRLLSSVVLWSPAYGANAATDSNIALKDSPKLRLELCAGAVSPYKENIISKYWGWETSSQITYGNSLQWVSLQYDLSEQINSQSSHHKTTLRLEFSMSLDKQKQREEGAGW